jgi:hypothetical protein
MGERVSRDESGAVSDIRARLPASEFDTSHIVLQVGKLNSLTGTSERV